MSVSALQPGKRYVMLRDFFFLDLWLVLSMEWRNNSHVSPLKCPFLHTVEAQASCNTSCKQYHLQAYRHSKQWTVTILKDMKSSQLLHISTIQRNDNNSKRLQKRGWGTINGSVKHLDIIILSEPKQRSRTPDTKSQQQLYCTWLTCQVNRGALSWRSNRFTVIQKIASKNGSNTRPPIVDVEKWIW